MRLALHTVICCCVFTSVLPRAKGATGELNTSLKKSLICSGRFREWLQSCIKRDLRNSLVSADDSDVHVGLQQDRNAQTVSSLSSFGSIRSRRSTSSKCVLPTCVYTDLLYRLHQMKPKPVDKVDQGKISPKGYGRRRRSLQDVVQLALQTGRQRSSEAASKVSLAAETEDNPRGSSLT